MLASPHIQEISYCLEQSLRMSAVVFYRELAEYPIEEARSLCSSMNQLLPGMEQATPCSAQVAVEYLMAALCLKEVWY
jgi:hypothetical protein